MTLIPAFSIVIPVRDGRDVIRHALDSVRAQTFEEFEVVVVDDGSVDGSLDVVAEVSDSRFRGVTQEAAGRSAARNRGAREAGGRWLAFLDCDDEVEPAWLESFHRALDSGDNALVCCAARVRLLGPSGEVRRERVRLPELRGPEYLGHRLNLLAGSWVVSKSVFDTVGGYEESLAFSENAELLMRIAWYLEESGKSIVHLDEPNLVYRKRRQRDAAGMAEARLEATQRILALHEPRLRAIGASVAAGFHTRAGVNAARLGRRREALVSLQRSLALRPWALSGYWRWLGAWAGYRWGAT